MRGELAHRAARDVHLPDGRALVVAAERIFDAREGDGAPVVRPRDLRGEDAARIGRRDGPRAASDPARGAARRRNDPEVIRWGERGGRIVVVAGVKEGRGRLRVGGDVGDRAPVGTPDRVDHVTARVRQLQRSSVRHSLEQLARAPIRGLEVNESRVVRRPARHGDVAALHEGPRRARARVDDDESVDGRIRSLRDRDEGDPRAVGGDRRLLEVDDPGHVPDREDGREDEADHAKPVRAGSS